MVGQTVKCPKCQSEFVFAPTKSILSENRLVTDTGVVRILGDMPQPVPPPEKPADSEKRGVTDTGVVRILSDVSQLPPQTPTHSTVAMRPCSRCNVPIPESETVCSHCNCYVGVMPTFLQQMTGNNDANRS